MILVAYMYSETIITAAREIDLGIFGIKPKLEHVSPQDERIKALSHAFE
ncbi:MAG: hypothetical protein IJ228_13860 [Succinivibrio sp.]|nr:hypothetical protein [Succinivibrio sp.]